MKILRSERYGIFTVVEVQDEKSMSQAQADISSLLMTAHNISDPLQADFFIIKEGIDAI